VLHVLAVELPRLPYSIGEHYIPHRNVRTGCGCRALELGHGRLGPRTNCPLARTAANALEGDVGEQCASPAIRLLARKGAVWYVCTQLVSVCDAVSSGQEAAEGGRTELTVTEELQWPIDILEDHILVSDISHGSCRVRPALHTAATSRRLALSTAWLPSSCSDVTESNILDCTVSDSSDREPVSTVAGQVPHDRVAATLHTT
jgi:hypothetical protein